MTAHERACRNAEVIRARARGLGWSTIGERLGLSDRHCRRVVADYRASAPGLHELDPIDTVMDAIESHDAAIEELALLAEQTGNDAVRLGAIKSRLEAVQHKMALLGAIGALPDLRRLRVELDAPRLAQAILEVFADHGVSDETQAAILERIERGNGVRAPRASSLVSGQQNGVARLNAPQADSP